MTGEKCDLGTIIPLGILRNDKHGGRQQRCYQWVGGGVSQVLDSSAGTKTGSGDLAVPESISRQFVNNPTLQHLYDKISSRMGEESDLLVCIWHQTHAS